MLKKVAADFVKAEVPAHQMTQWYKNKQTFQPQLIKKAAELGWLGMMLPEEYGGAGVTTMDCAVVFEELGHGPVPGPLFTSGVLSAQMIFEAGTQQQRTALLPPSVQRRDRSSFPPLRIRPPTGDRKPLKRVLAKLPTATS